MQPPQVSPVNVYGGDPLRLEYRFRASSLPDADYIDMTGWGVTARWVSSADSSHSLDFDTSESDFPNGVLVLRLSKAQTAAMGGHGKFDAQQAGDEGETILVGRTMWRAGLTDG